MAGGPYKKPSGWYFITWTQNGRQVKEALKTKSLPEARRRMKRLERDYFDGKHDPFIQKWFERPDPTSTMQQAVKEYIRFKTHQKGRKGWKTERTTKSHSNVIHGLLNYAGRKPITRQVLHDFLHRPEIKSDYTRVGYKSKIDAFLSWCEEHGYIDQAPRVEVDEPQTEIKEYIRDDMLRAIFAEMDRMASMPPQERYGSKFAGFSFDTSWYADFCRVAVGTGLRPSEMVQIQPGDVNQSDIYVGKSFRVKVNFQRKVPLDDPFSHVIHRYRDPDFRAADPALSESPTVFGRSRLRELNRDLKAACRAVGAPVILTVGEMRHLFAIRFLLRHRGEGDFALLRLMQVMGHRQLSTTQGYLNYLPSDGEL